MAIHRVAPKPSIDLSTDEATSDVFNQLRLMSAYHPFIVIRALPPLTTLLIGLSHRGLSLSENPIDTATESFSQQKDNNLGAKENIWAERQRQKQQKRMEEWEKGSAEQKCVF